MGKDNIKHQTPVKGTPPIRKPVEGIPRKIDKTQRISKPVKKGK